MPSKIIGFANIAINTEIKGFKTGLAKAKEVLSGEFSNMQKKASEFGNRFSKSLASIQQNAVKFDRLTPALANVVTGIGKLSDAINPASKKFTDFQFTAGGAMKAVGATIATAGIGISALLSPIGLITVAIGSFGRLAVQNLDQVIRVITDTINFFIELYNENLLLRVAFEYMSLTFKNAFDILRNYLKLSLDGFGGLAKVIQGIATGDFSKIAQGGLQGFKALKTFAKDTSADIGDNFTQAFNNAVNNRIEFVSESTIRSAVGAFFKLGSDAGKKANEAIQNQFDITNGYIKKFFANLATPLDLTFNYKIEDLPQLDALPSQGVNVEFQSDDGGVVTAFERVQEIIQSIQKDSSIINELAQTYGNNINPIVEKLDLWREGLKKLINEEFKAASPEIKLFEQRIRALEDIGVSQIFDDARAALSRLNAGIGEFANEQDVASAKTTLFNDTINLLKENFNGPLPEAIEQGFKEMFDFNNEMARSVNLIPEFTALTNVVTDTFGKLVFGAKNGSQAIQGLITGIFGIMAGILDKLGDAAIRTGATVEAMKASFISFGGLGSIAAGLALKVFASSMKSFVADIPALAKGGLAFSETLAIVGDNPNASIDPEVIAPLSKLKNMINSGATEVVGKIEVQGDELFVILENAAQTRGYVYG